MMMWIRTGLLGLAAAMALAGLGFAWNPALVLVAGFEAAHWFTSRAGASMADCSGRWSPPIDASLPYLVPFFPETGATYRLLTVDTEIGDRKLGFTVAGIMPQARYASLHAYEAGSGRIVAALADHEIAQPGAPFSLSVGAPGTQGAALALPAGLDRLTLVWRQYGAAEPPPAVTASFADGKDGEPSCPWRLGLPDVLSDATSLAERRAALDAIAAGQAARVAAGDPAPIRFFVLRGVATPFYASRHVIYAFAPLDPALGAAAEITLPALRLRDGAGPGLRYWSVCLSGERSTATAACLGGEDFAIAADGTVHVTIGDGGALPWGWFSGRRLLIIRQLDTAEPFAGGDPASFALVPDFDPARPIDGQSAEKVLGALAPVGRYRPQGR